MIADKFSVKQIVKMFRASELKIVPIVTGDRDPGVPGEYMLYGEPIDRYSHALAALRNVCDEINRRRFSGLVVPRLIVSVDNVDALLVRSGDGEIAGLLDIISEKGADCGVELVA